MTSLKKRQKEEEHKVITLLLNAFLKNQQCFLSQNNQILPSPLQQVWALFALNGNCINHGRFFGSVLILGIIPKNLLCLAFLQCSDRISSSMN